MQRANEDMWKVCPRMQGNLWEEYENQTLRYIEGLPELYRSVARHRLVEGMQYKEIAEETGLELNTVRTRIRRAKAMIEKMKQNESSNQE